MLAVVALAYEEEAEITLEVRFFGLLRLHILLSHFSLFFVVLLLLSLCRGGLSVRLFLFYLARFSFVTLAYINKTEKKHE